MFGFIAKRNIKIVFGMNKIVKKPFFAIHEEFDLDILIGFDCTTNHFDLFYILDDFNENTLKSNNKFALSTKKPEEIFELFNREIKSENASRKIRLVDQFSKTFAECDKHKPFYQLEGMALLYALDHFRLEILRSTPVYFSYRLTRSFFPL